MREVHVDAALERTGFEPKLELARPLRTQIRVAKLVRREARLAFVAGNGRPRASRVERTRRLSGLTERGAQLEEVDPLRGPEAVVRDDVRRADLWVGLQTEIVAERAVPVDTHARRQRQAIVPAQLFLQEEPGVDLALTSVVRHVPACCRLQGWLVRSGKLVADERHRPQVVLKELTTPGER